jgi:MSHA biogenesis protein MshJ
VKALQNLLLRVNRLSLRERGLIFAAGVAVLSMTWFQLIIRPLQQRQAEIAQSLDDIGARLSRGADGRGDDGVAAEYASLKSREIAMGSAVAATEAELHDAQRGMIEPKQMVDVLTDVLQHQKDLTLVLLRNLPVQPLLPAVADPKTGQATTAGGPYLHPVEIVVRGDYLNVLAYLRALESRPYGFQWRRFELASTDDGPEYRIQFMTLSMQPNWLGV